MGCPVIEPFDFRWLENTPAEIICWTAVLPAMHVQKHILQATSQWKPATFPSSVSGTSCRSYCWQWSKLIGQQKKFLRHTWALHFRDCSTLGLRVFWLYTISADFALGTSRNFEKLYQLSCESCIVYLNCLDFPKRVHSFLYGKSFWQHSTKLFLSMVWIITFALHCKVIEVKN